MKKLDRKRYNQLIKDLNTSNDIDKAIISLSEEYQKLLCHLPDYEELVMLSNLCIAEDRGNRFDELYVHYRRVEEILSKHSGFGLHNAYELYYCAGMFSFKFHYYERATDYFNKCITDIKSLVEDPLSHGPTRNYFIHSMILISYALEYDKKPNAAYEAIINILNDRKIDVATIQIEEVYSMYSTSSAGAVEFFFKNYPSKIYDAADDEMKKEIIHMLAHCFSEYATCLRGQSVNGKKIYYAFFWEILSEKFIEYLGNDMVTCRATILAEHGHYYQALDLLRKRHKALKNSPRKSEKAEIAFYIYYFSNRIGLDDDDDDIQKYKDEFLSYAVNTENKDTKLYAWITKFRAEFSKTVSALSPANIEELEKIFEENVFDSSAHSYAHPQIQEEEKRLQLAYQIIRSYTLINDAAKDSDNGLFEKCVLFNTLNLGSSRMKKLEPLPKDIPQNEDVFLYIHGIVLCVYGCSKQSLQQLSNYFHTEIQQAEKNTMGHQKILILSDEMQISAFTVDSEERILAYFVYCEKENLKEKFRQESGIDEDCIFFSSLEDTFRVAYIQETIEQCHVCVHRWGEYFIMAPIPDNSTFAFQSQVIKQYIGILEEPETEKTIFYDSNGYVSTDFTEPVSVEEVPYPFSLSKARPDSQWRAFFYFKNWVYRFDREKNAFIPETFCENRSNMVNQFEQLCEKRPTRSDKRKKECSNCQVKQSKCACKDYPLSRVKGKVENYLMSLSLDPIRACESTCSLVFPEEWEKGSPDCFMLILSDTPVLDCSLRKSFDELVSLCKKPVNSSGAGRPDNESSNTTISTPICDHDFEAAKKDLYLKIQAYQDKELDNLSEKDQEYIISMLNKVESCPDRKSLIQLESEWSDKTKEK